MRMTTTNPMTGNEPFVIEGEGEDALKIYFESEESAEKNNIDAYNEIAGNETMGTIN